MACGKSEPTPPTETPPPTVTVTGTERLGWMQEAADARELSTFRYAIYLDGLRTELTGVSCQPSPTSANFDCAAPLPAMPGGRHTLQLVTFVIDGDLQESLRSAPLLVNKTGAATAAATAPPNASRP